MTILEVINKTTPYFEKQGVDSPRLTIELLLAHLLKKKRLQLYLEFERELDEKTLAALREMVKRRAAGEPVQYITGEAEFCGLKLMVDKRVLIPRPETELLVETVLERMRDEGGGRRAEDEGGRPADDRGPRAEAESGKGKRRPQAETPAPPSENLKVVDVGTGSGCIAIALAKKLPDAEITAIDVSPQALEVARGNAALHHVEKNTRFLESDLLDNLDSSFRADVIVSNPPYIADGEIVELPKEVRDFEPVKALQAGEDGLKVIRRLVTSTRRLLSPSGFIALEIGAGQRAAVEDIFREQGYEVVEVVKDLQGHERVIVARPGK
ncbi:MAG TPA: HemK/PrmC family methyltransferase [Verrucomicrobiae bacterium]|nr:HemK/PrmC family methyltransferase [Verrucomicrobiae bacterium]